MPWRVKLRCDRDRETERPAVLPFCRASLRARRRARRVLLAKSDRLLADLGFSRELLEEGVKAWPWLVEPETTEVVATAAPVLELTEHQPVVAEVKHQVVEEQRHAA